MKVIILAGGFGTRLSEYTGSIPKPMVTIGDKPIIWHIMQRYSMFGFNDFVIALGYKSNIVKEYFFNYHNVNSDFSINLETGTVEFINKKGPDWNVTLVDTGLNTQTGGRIKRLKTLIGSDTFMVTYGDGVSDIDFTQLLDFHNSHGKLVTVSAVRPIARFGEISLHGQEVVKFAEKSQTDIGWINGGFFVMEPEFIEYISDDTSVLEKAPLEEVSKLRQLQAFLHAGFWQCMDTQRDRDYLDKIARQDNVPWLN